jgi:hypothetical protein
VRSHGGLEVLRQPSIAPDPRKEPLDDPAPRVNSEADLVGIFAHNFDGDQRGPGDLLTGISAVGEDPLNEREDAPRDSQKRSATIAILDAGRMRFEHEAAAVGVNERVPLAPVDLLSSVVAAQAAGLGGLDGLAVDNRSRGAGVAPRPVRDLPSRARGLSVQSARRRARWRTSGKSSPMAASRSAAAATGSPPA